MAALQEGIRLGSYTVEQLLPTGQGGFAQVAVARSDVSGTQQGWVAIKVARTRPSDNHRGDPAELVKQYADALIEEAETLRNLRHPSIVRIYPIPLDGGRVSYVARAKELDSQPWYFIMEYLAGGSLEALVDAHGQLDPALAVEITQQIGAALHYVHALRLAHLDVKASNVIFRRPVDNEHRPIEAVLIDFGSVQKSQRQADAESLTLAYASPERILIKKGQATPESFVDKPAADVYSLGIMLYRMLTGRLPFAGSRAHIMTDILNAAPTQPQVYTPALGRLPELNELVMAMLDKRPEGRPKMSEVLTQLEDAIPSPRVWAGLPPPKLDKRRANPWKGAAAGMMFLTLLAAPAGYYFGRGSASPLPSPSLVPGITVAPAATPTSTASVPPKTSPSRVTTSTATPTRRNAGATVTPTVTPMVLLTATPVPTFTPTPTVIAQPTVAQGTGPVVNTPTTSGPASATRAPVVIEPGDNESRGGQVTFRWQPSGPLPAGAGYEVVWWLQNTDPNTARGFTDPTSGTSLTVNLDRVFDSQRTICWTVLVVSVGPYQRLTQPSVGVCRRLTYQP